MHNIHSFSCHISNNVMKVDAFMFGFTVTHMPYYLSQIHLLPACYCFLYLKQIRSLKLMCVKSFFFP